MTGRPGLGELCRLILKHAAFTVGGGSVTVVALERDLVDSSRWISLDRFRTIYGIARITPGTSILALVAGIGWDFYRWPGALLALALSAIPGSVVAALLAAVYVQLYENDIARRFLVGAAAAVCGLIGASIWRMLQPYLKSEEVPSTLVVFGVVLVLSFFGFSPFPIFIGLGVAGFFLHGFKA